MGDLFQLWLIEAREERYAGERFAVAHPSQSLDRALGPVEHAPAGRSEGFLERSAAVAVSRASAERLYGREI
jgi:hypothetical protein